MLPSRFPSLVGFVFWIFSTSGSFGEEIDTLKVGLQPDGRIVVPTNQILQPAGTQVVFPGRPVDLVLIDEGKTLVVKSMRELLFIEVASGKIKQTLASSGKEKKFPGFSAIGLVAHQDRIYVSDVSNFIRIAKRQANGNFAWDDLIELEKPAVSGAIYPTGMALYDKEHLWVASSRGNSIQRVDLTTQKVDLSVDVGVAPYAIQIVNEKKLYVSNWGGDRPKKDDPQSKTSGTPVKVDPRTNIANHGTVSVVEKTDTGWKQTKTIEVGQHPSGMTVSKYKQFLYVANANSDTVSVIDTKSDTVKETIACRPESRLPFGSGCNALAISPDNRTLYVANGTNNGLAVIALGVPAYEPIHAEAAIPTRTQVEGFIPTGWYPGAIQISSDGKKLFVANIKGHGALSERRDKEKGHNSHDHLGTVSLIDVPDGKTLREYTERVNKHNRLTYALTGLEKPRIDAKPIPIPMRHGEPSVFEHVIYVIKENRTYDQVFGDIKEANGDANLCIFPEEVTPNHHKLVREFTLFDNFYCSGVLSADGHSWVNNAYVTDYLEKAFGGFTRSYPYEGSDPLAFPTTGYLWDNALAYKKTFRNYGEHCKTTYEPKNATWSDVYSDFVKGTNKVQISVNPNVKTLEPYSHPKFPGFPLRTPDVYRAKLFLEDLKRCEQKGTFPNLTYVFLPNNHTEGTRPGNPTPRAMVADNDLALGQIVEGVSKSKFWEKTCIFVVEDDPQNGFDHVDGHRTVAMVISPYTKRKQVDSTCYNQTSMVKTIEMILGIPPMTQMDLSATPMRSCFQEKPDLTPYHHVKNNIPLDEMNKPLEKLKGKELFWAKKSMELDFDKEDLADEDTFNRILWFAMRGEKPYPLDGK